MLENLFIKVFPMIVSTLGVLCFKYAIPMRRLLFYFTFSLIFLVILASSFAGGFLYLYNGAMNEMDSDLIKNKFPCDTAVLKFGQHYDDGIITSQSILIEHEQIAASNFQYWINFALIAFYTSVGLLIVTYISTYISKYKIKKLIENNKNKPPPQTP